MRRRTWTGFVDVIHGEGMPIYHLSGHGDLFVEYQVVLPPTLTSQQREGPSNFAANYSAL